MAQRPLHPHESWLRLLVENKELVDPLTYLDRRHQRICCAGSLGRSSRHRQRLHHLRSDDHVRRYRRRNTDAGRDRRRETQRHSRMGAEQAGL